MTSVSEYIKNKFGMRVQTKETIATIATTSGETLPLNPNRIYVIMMNLSANNGYAMPGGLAASSSAGVLLTANGGSISLSADEDFELVTESWNTIQDTAQGTWLIIEGLIY